MEEESVTRIGVSLPPKLLEKFDTMTENMGYANRSEAIRDAIREYILKNELKNENGDKVGVISIIFDHDVKGVNDMLVELQHIHHEVIQSSIHIHITQHNCMELIIVKGDTKKIKEIKDRLTSISGVKHSDLLVAGTEGYI